MANRCRTINFSAQGCCATGAKISTGSAPYFLIYSNKPCTWIYLFHFLVCCGCIIFFSLLRRFIRIRVVLHYSLYCGYIDAKISWRAHLHVLHKVYLNWGICNKCSVSRAGFAFFRTVINMYIWQYLHVPGTCILHHISYFIQKVFKNIHS